MTLAVSPARSRKPSRLLPEQVQQRLRRALHQGVGFVLLAVVLLLGCMLISYDPADPSLNTGSTGHVRNWLGGFGAATADLAMQSLGRSAWLIVVVLLFWGVQLIVRGGYRLRRGQVLKAIAALLLTALGTGVLAATMGESAPALPSPGGLMGSLGGGGLVALLGRVGVPVPLAETILAAGALSAAIALTVVSFGMSPQDWKQSGSSIASWTRRGAAHGRTVAKASGRGAQVLGGAAKTGATQLHGVGRWTLTPLFDWWAARREALRVDPLEGMGAAAVSIGAVGKVMPRIDMPANAVFPEDNAAAFAPEGLDEDEPDYAEEGEDGVVAATRADDDAGIAEDPVPTPAPPPVPETVLAEHWAAPQVTQYTHAEAPPPGSAEPERARLGVKSLLRRRPATPGPATAAAAADATLGPLPVPAMPLGGPFELPSLQLLRTPNPAARAQTYDASQLQERARALEAALSDYGVRGAITGVQPGPVVTLYELEPAPGTKAQRVIGLADDIARTMCAHSVRIATVPGRNVIGIELPNERRQTVFLRELLESGQFQDNTGKLALALGKDIGGEPVVTDLARMPHLLVAGTTGSGKSVGINTMICSLVYRLSPEKCRFIMIDPKMVELSIYEGIPHLLAPVVTDPKKAVVALKWAVREMEQRYRLLQRLAVRNIDSYNDRIREARDNGEMLTRRVQTGFDPDTGRPVMEEQTIDLKDLPYIVVIIDEMADLMMIAGKDIEASVQRLAQMARAVGIHLVTATQRPSVDVITGTIKANFPTRISFAVTSKIDSRTILGEQGAEQLLGQGDMLYMINGRVTRVHGPFVSDGEVEQIVRHLKAQGMPDYVEAVTEVEEEDEDGEGGSAGGSGDEGEDLYDRAVAMVARERKCSTSFVQRQFSIGYNRAAKLVERMEKEGVVGPANHAGKREVLVRSHDRE